MAGSFEVVDSVTSVEEVSGGVNAIDTVVEDSAVTPHVDRTSLVLYILFSCQ